MLRQTASDENYDTEHTTVNQLTRLIEYMFKAKIAKNQWMQPCPENNKFDRFLNSFPTRLQHNKETAIEKMNST